MPEIAPLNVFIVDDSILYRRIIQSVLEDFPDVAVVGSAPNGKIALAKASILKPDLLILDIEMPVMDGLEVLEHLKDEVPDTLAVVFSVYTTEGARITLRALDLGAFDFIPKIRSENLKENEARFKSAISPILEAVLARRQLKALAAESPVSGEIKSVEPPPVSVFRKAGASRAVAIGISTGGPVALTRLLPRIPGHLGVPIFIVQHMPPVFTDVLARKLDSICALTVKEAVDGEPVQPGTIYIAPGGKQMRVANALTGNSLVIQVNDDPPENNCKPSADYLFRSVARHYGRYATGVIMTGMGHDGTEGLILMKEKGAVIIAQDESTCAVYGMPRKPIELGIVDEVVPLERIAAAICRTVR